MLEERNMRKIRSQGTIHEKKKGFREVQDAKIKTTYFQ